MRIPAALSSFRATGFDFPIAPAIYLPRLGYARGTGKSNDMTVRPGATQEGAARNLSCIEWWNAIDIKSHLRDDGGDPEARIRLQGARTVVLTF